MRILLSELHKLLTLPGVWLGVAVSLVLTVGASALAAFQEASYGVPARPDDGFGQLVIVGVIGVIVVGVLSISSEYVSETAESGGGRQITTTLLLSPGCMSLLLRKLAAVGIAAAVFAAVAVVATLGMNAFLHGTSALTVFQQDYLRGLGVVIYFVLTAWIASGITLMVRSGVIPLAVLIANSSMVSVSFLLSQLFTAANYLPDRAGMAMFIHDQPGTVTVQPIVGGLVMLAWTMAIVLIGAAMFQKRDA